MFKGLNDFLVVSLSFQGYFVEMIEGASILSNYCHKGFGIYLVKDVFNEGLVISLYNFLLLKSILNVWNQAKHNIIISKETSLGKCIHVVVLGIKQIDISFLYHIKELKLVTFVLDYIILILLTSDVRHQLSCQSLWNFEIWLIIYE